MNLTRPRWRPACLNKSTPRLRRPRIRRWSPPAGLLWLLGAVLALTSLQPPLCLAAPMSLSVEPPVISLAGPGSEQRIIVTSVADDGTVSDITTVCEISTSDAGVLSIDAGRATLKALRPGKANLTARLGERSQVVEVAVGTKPEADMAVNFTRDVVSILTFKGCNGSGCHGSPAGQNGFKLSLFGYDSAADHKMIVSEHEARRVNLDDPGQSLLLLKPTFQVAHGGGRLMEEGSEDYQTLLNWLRQGAELADTGAELTRLELYPQERVLVGRGAQQRLVVVGHLSDGTTRDMTGEASLNVVDESVAGVSAEGWLTAADPGLTTVTARAVGKVATAQIAVIEQPAGDDYPSAAANNFIDELVFAKLKELNVRPGQLSSDREFARRVYLDTIGLLPTREELSRFLDDPRSDKRAQLIDELLRRPEHALLWTVRFEDWFRNIQLHMQGRNQGVFKDWLRDWLGGDHSYAELVRALLTSQGDSMKHPEANFWFPATDFMHKTFSVNKMTPTVTRLFMGIRMECAECHNHPLENYTQDDFYGMAAFFGRLKVKHGLSAYRRTWFLDDEGEVEHPLTKEPVRPKFLGAERPEIAEGEDRRQALADWLTSPDNPYFARATVNRIWFQYFRTGIVDPFDDFRSTNRPTNPELLDRLAEFFVESGYQFRPLERLILNSRAYQLSSAGGEPSKMERLLFARYVPRKVSAEVLLDMISQVTDVSHRFPKYPPGTSAKELYIPDVPDYFLATFGLPRRDILKERVETPTLAQALHLMNGESTRDKVESPDNAIGAYLEEGLSDEEIARRIYERAYSRLPTGAEMQLVSDFSASERDAGRDRRRTWENVIWAVLNSKEFHLNH